MIEVSSLKLREVIAALENRGRHDEAKYYQLIVPLQLMIKQGFSEKQVMNMTVDEIDACLRLPPKPLKYEGWDTFYWGNAVIADSQG